MNDRQYKKTAMANLVNILSEVSLEETQTLQTFCLNSDAKINFDNKEEAGNPTGRGYILSLFNSPCLTPKPHYRHLLKFRLCAGTEPGVRQSSDAKCAKTCVMKQGIGGKARLKEHELIRDFGSNVM